MPAGPRGRGMRSNQRVLDNMDRVEPLLGQRPAKTVGLMCLKPLLSSSHGFSAPSAPNSQAKPPTGPDAAPAPRRPSRFGILARRAEENLQEPWVHRAADRELFGCVPTAAAPEMTSASSSTASRSHLPPTGKKKATESVKNTIASNASSLALATSVYTAPVVKDAQLAAGRSPRSRHNLPKGQPSGPPEAAATSQCAGDSSRADELQFVRMLMYRGALRLQHDLADATPALPQKPRSKCAPGPAAASAVVQPARPRRSGIVRSEEVPPKERANASGAAPPGASFGRSGGRIAPPPEKSPQRRHGGRRASSIATVAEDEDELATHVTRDLLQDALLGHAAHSRACTPLVAAAAPPAPSCPEEFPHQGDPVEGPAMETHIEEEAVDQLQPEPAPLPRQEYDEVEPIHAEDQEAEAAAETATLHQTPEQDERLEEDAEDADVELPVMAPLESVSDLLEALAEHELGEDDDVAQPAPPEAVAWHEHCEDADAVQPTALEEEVEYTPLEPQQMEAPHEEPGLVVSDVDDDFERTSSGYTSVGLFADTNPPPRVAVVSTTASPGSTPSCKALNQAHETDLVFEEVTIEDAEPPSSVPDVSHVAQRPLEVEEDSKEANLGDLAAPFSALTAMRASGPDVEDEALDDDGAAVDFVPRRRLVRTSMDMGTHDEARAEAAAEFVLHGAFNKEVEVHDSKAIEAVGACVQDSRVEVRLAAVKALFNAAAAGDQSAIEAVGLGLQDAGPLVQRASIRALEQAAAAGSSAALEVACSHLNHKESRVRAAAARALSKSVENGHSAAIEALIAQLEHSDAIVRAAAIDMLRSSLETGHADALPSVCKSLQDSDARVRYLALNALSIAWERGLPISSDMINLSPEETNAYVRRSADELLLRVRRRAPEEESRQRISWMSKKHPSL
mmetsp:Transcript_9377/g.16966  ORF Transcript_9377/g.16966 Transcript_9377/m.16966 type:complete len:910 (+) Transcript_9377:96-2825(+)